MPYPWKTRGYYDGAEYVLEHLAPFRRSIKLLNGDVRLVEFQFSYHCFTDSQNKGGVGHRRFEDVDYPSENRVFCPQRWFMSHRLRELLLSDEVLVANMAATRDYQWVIRQAYPDITLPYTIYLRVAPGAPGGPIIVLARSAHTRPDPQNLKGRAERLNHVLTETHKTGQIQGIPT